MPSTKKARVAEYLDPDAIPEIAEWLHMVEDGRIEACIEQHLLCSLIRHIFERERLYLNRERLDRYKGYQRYFPFDLEPDELFMLTLMLCVYTEDGIPRFKELFLYVGRGYGKNGFITFIVFCLLSPANGILEYDVHVVATTEDQAKTSFDELCNIFDRDEKNFSRGFHWTKTEVKNFKTSSIFKFLTANAQSKDGGRPGAIILDEEHAYQDNKTMGVLKGGLGKKPDARIFKITTDGDVREGPLDEDKELAEDILNGKVEDNRVLPMVFKLDHPDEINDESKWPKANPSVTRRPDLLQEYRDDYREWHRHPQKHPEVPTKRFNCPQQRMDIAVTTRENLVAASRDIGDVSGLPCILGIDYARTTDMLGAVLLFNRDGEYQCVNHAWWCTHSSDAGEVKAPLEKWADDGWLTIVDDVDISPTLMTEWAQEWADDHGCTIQMAAIDDYRITLVKDALKSIGLDSTLTGDKQQVYRVRPSDQMRVHSVIDSAFANHLIAWGDSPLMRWSTNNAMLVPAQNENWKYGKIAPHSRKTDAFMAMVAAFAVVDRLPKNEPLIFAAPFYF